MLLITLLLLVNNIESNNCLISVNEYNQKALRLIRQDVDGHPLYIQDIAEIDDIALQMASRAKTAMAWLKQLCDSGDNLDGTDAMFTVSVWCARSRVQFPDESDWFF